ncbi:hypothetical protein AWC11_07375 [Mycobacterium interjectum]|nr:hypothetical protein AWC11_07375 [Mycobacterium interjectum]
MIDENATADLLAAIALLCLASALIGAILEYCAAAIHHSHRAHDWLAREIRAWRRHRARTHRKPL